MKTRIYISYSITVSHRSSKALSLTAVHGPEACKQETKLVPCVLQGGPIRPQGSEWRERVMEGLNGSLGCSLEMAVVWTRGRGQWTYFRCILHLMNKKYWEKRSSHG